MVESIAFVRTATQKLSSLDPPRVVHREQLDRGASNCRNAFDKRSAKMEMIGPSVASRMEQRDSLAGHRIDASQVRAFPQVAAVTREGEISYIVASAMPARYDVLDGPKKKCRIGDCRLTGAPPAEHASPFRRPFDNAAVIKSCKSGSRKQR